MEITVLIQKLKGITNNLYDYKRNIYSEIRTYIPELSECYNKLIGWIPQLNKIGIDIDTNGVIGQLQNLLIAIDKRDMILTFDTLKYEICDTLLFIDEIEKIINNGEKI